jgi:PAS domain S-box-containing protein
VHLVASQRIAHVGSWELDLASPNVDVNVLQWSDEAYRVFGYESGQAQPSHDAFWARVHPEDRQKVQQAVRQAIDSRSVYEIEHRIVLDDGAVRIIHERAELAMDPRTGNPVKFIGTSQDVTQRREVEEALTVQQAELLHASRLSTVGQMVASLSHEVAQPLSAIENFAGACAGILESAAADGVSADHWRKLTEYTSAIMKQNERCRGILQRLRDFSGRTRRLSSCDLNELLRDSAELTAYEFRRHGIALRFDLADSLPPVHVDRIQIQQVIVNLLTNSRDSICDLPTARREIIIRSRLAEKGVWLEVEDRGKGLSEEVRRRLFEPFFTTKPSGMGIGLSICQTIVKDHGGQIEALTNIHGGATFCVQVPLSFEGSHA